MRVSKVLTNIISICFTLLCTFVGAMGIIFLMILVSVSLALVFLILFIIGAKQGQFDEDESPAVRILKENNKLNEPL